jgi:hypothetical protein
MDVYNRHRYRRPFFLPRTLSSNPAFWSAVTLWRHSGPASYHRRGRTWEDLEGCDHADGTPAAYLEAGRADRIALPEGAPLDVFRYADGCRSACRRKTLRTARPVEARSACPVAASATVAVPDAASASASAPVADAAAPTAPPRPKPHRCPTRNRRRRRGCRRRCRRRCCRCRSVGSWPRPDSCRSR